MDTERVITPSSKLDALPISDTYFDVGRVLVRPRYHIIVCVVMGDANSLVWRAKVLGYAQFVIRKERSETFGRYSSNTVPVAMSCHVYDFCRSG